MGRIDSFLLFRVEKVWYALNVESVKRIVRAVEIAFLPDAPPFIRGLINVSGDIIPVIDMRQRIGLPCREMELSDRLILTSAADKQLALLVDSVEGVVQLPVHSLTNAKTAVRTIESTAVNFEGNIILIQPMEAFLSEAAFSQLQNLEGDQGE